LGKLTEFAPIFFPKTHAVIGASNSPAKFGGLYFRAQLTFGYKGNLVPINRDEPEVSGKKAYAKVTDYPGEIDFASIFVPARAVPEVLEDCLRKGIPAAQVITAGFRELSEEGRRLEEQVKAISRRGIRVIGPNCFGVYSPGGGVTVMPGGDLPKEPGTVGFISQSGGYAARLPRRAEGIGIHLSKLVSYGNASDINECDLLEYFYDDPDTRIITFYLEGVNDGPRFLKLLKQACREKPVIIWKGGLTEGGARAVMSHTASLSGSAQIWDAIFKQTGAVSVSGLEEFLDTVLAFLHLPPVKDNRVGIIGGGGGIGVAAADACEKAGITLPVFSPEIQAKLARLAPAQGSSVRNPVDVGSPFPSPAMLEGVMEAVFTSAQIDAVILDELEMSPVARDGKIEPTWSLRFDGVKQVPIQMQAKYRKPVIMVLPVEGIGADFINAEASRRRVAAEYQRQGLPVFLSLERAAGAFSKFANYWKFRNQTAV